MNLIVVKSVNFAVLSIENYSECNFEAVRHKVREIKKIILEIYKSHHS